jgi:hypothetical protein
MAVIFVPMMYPHVNFKVSATNRFGASNTLTMFKQKAIAPMEKYAKSVLAKKHIIETDIADARAKNHESPHSFFAQENLGFLPIPIMNRVAIWKVARKMTPMRLLAHVILIHS